MKLADIAKALSGRLIGDPNIELSQASSLEHATSKSIAFLTNPRYRRQAITSQAGALVVSEGMAADHGEEFSCPVIAVENPSLAMIDAINMFWQPPQRNSGISDRAFVDPDAQLGEHVSVMPLAHVGKATIGAGSRIFPQAFIDDDVVIGQNCEIRPGCVLMNGTRLGDRVILQPGAVLGADGFGYAPDGKTNRKIPQIGSVEIANDVEIGANTSIDRGSFDATRVGQGSKIDNMVQLGHNVQIGKNVILVSQVGIAGSTTVKDGAILAGKVGVRDHVTIGNNARIGAYSAVAGDVPDQGAYSGIPAMPHGSWLRIALHMKNIEKTVRRVRKLERRLDLLDTATAPQDATRPEDPA